MISRLFKKKPQVTAPLSPTAPEGEIVWAVGDIHGRFDLLQPIVEHIIADTVVSDARRTVVVFLGDYIDRGPQSREVIQYLGSLSTDCGIEWRFLKGNHEEAMLDFLKDPTTGPTWCEYGGDATLASYSLRLPQLKHKPEGWTHLSMDLNHKITTRERDFLEKLEYSIWIGDYFFAHAGARPGVALDQQSERDLMWIRGSFLESDLEFRKVVVHGHTPVANVYVDRRRICLDTQAYATSRLTALRLQGEERRFLQCQHGVVDSIFGPR